MQIGQMGIWRRGEMWKPSVCSRILIEYLNNFTCTRNVLDNLVIVCVRACVRACVCVFIFFHREGFFRLQDVQGILEGTNQRSCVVNISWVLSAKFHHLRIWKCHISPPKTKTPAALLLERKRYDIIRSAKRWYILI